jgi:phage-related protein (TIGR01555 family)
LAEVSDNSQFREDGVLVNAITGLGTKRDKSAYYGIQSQGLMADADLEALYYDPLCRRVVDVFAEASLAKRPTIKFSEELEGHDEIIRNIEQYLEDSESFFYFEEALKLQRIYGGAAIFMVFDDGMEPSEPLNPARVRGIADLVPLSKKEITPDEFDYLNFRNPTQYRISTSKSSSNTNDLQYLLVHSSRILRFDGLYLPWRDRLNNSGWGLSALQVFYDPWKRYRGATDGLSTMLSEMDLFVHKIPGLANKITAGKESALKARLEANSLARSLYGGMALDSEEEVTFAARSLGGAQDIFDRLLDDLVAAADMPKPVLFGMSPAGGLSEAGKFEQKLWASSIERYQSHSLKRAFTHYMNIILSIRSGPTGGNLPTQWTAHFPPYFASSDADKANMRQQIALSDQIYLNAGVITAMEIRASRFGGTEYQLDTVLHSEEEDRLLAKRELEHEAALQGFEGQRQALENNAEAARVEPEQQAPDELVEDACDFLHMNGLTLIASTSNGIYQVAAVVHPDGQRNDSEPVVLIGGRLQDQKMYRGFVKRQDETIAPGPLLMGFYSSRSASRALSHYCDEEEVSGLTLLDPLDIEHLKVTFDRYDKSIDYAGMTFPGGYNSPVKTPDHKTKSHAVLAKEGEEVKLIRFGQQGVKGSPKTEGESEAARNRRKSFKARHAKNIAKGRMSAAYWSAKEKW